MSDVIKLPSSERTRSLVIRRKEGEGIVIDVGGVLLRVSVYKASTVNSMSIRVQAPPSVIVERDEIR